MNKLFAMAKILNDRKPIVLLSIRQQLGRRYWLLPIIVLAWPLLFGTLNFLFGATMNVGPEEVQNILIGFPLYFLALGLGSGIITNEIEQRTLEVTYTIPGGANRVWLLKLGSTAFLLFFSELIMAGATWVMFTEFPLSVLPGAFRAALFVLVVAMALGALLKNELIAAIITGSVGMFVLILTLEEDIGRWSPFFDPTLHPEIGPNVMLAWTIQNYIGYTLITLGIANLAFSRMERREQLLE